MVRPKTREQEQADLVVRDPKLKEMEPVALFAPAIDASDMTTIKDELLAAIGEREDGGSPGASRRALPAAPRRRLRVCLRPGRSIQRGWTWS